MPALRWSALPALISISAIALILLFTSGTDTSVKATNFGAKAPAGHPLPGLNIGPQLCASTLAWQQTPGGPDITFGGVGGGLSNYTGDCRNNVTNAPGANPDYVAPFLFDAPGANFSSITTLNPGAATIAPGPGHRDPGDLSVVDFNAAVHPDLGSIIGVVSSDPVKLSLKIGGTVTACNQTVTVEFAMMNATVDFLNPAGTAVDPAKLIFPKDPITALAEGNRLEPLAKDGDLDGLPDHINKYTSYMLDLFDPDKLNAAVTDTDTNTFYPEVDGPLLPLQPLARYAGRALVAGSDQILEFLVFSPGQLAQLGALVNHPSAQLFDFYGYPSVTVLNDPTVAATISTVQDFCTPLGTTTILKGLAILNSGPVGCVNPGGTDHTDGTDPLACLNNPIHGAVEDVRYTNPAASSGLLGTNQHFFIDYIQSMRDADNDGHENQLDTCPFNDNSLTGADPWNPRGSSPGDADSDGIPTPCDLDDVFITGNEINQDEKDAGGDPSASPPIGSAFTCNACVASGTSLTVTITPDPLWTTNEFVNQAVTHAIGGTKTIVSNTSDTLTIAAPWIGIPVAGDIDIFGDTFINRQDNCPLVINQAQFQQELVSTLPEDGGERADGIGDLCDPNPTTADGHYHADMNFYPYCLSTNLGADDSDTDGWCDAIEATLGSVSSGTAADGRAAVDSTPEHVYLDLRYNLARQQASINVANGARPNVSQCELGSVVCLTANLTEEIPAGTAADPWPHPDSGEPVGAVPLFCNDGVDNNGDGNVDREDSQCQIGTNFATLGTGPGSMREDLDDALLPVTDLDGDGVIWWQESIRGSDPLEACKAGASWFRSWIYDVDDSGQVSAGDVFAVFPDWLKSESDNSFTYKTDVSGNGGISAADVFAIFPKWLQFAPGCP